jgi:transmembrane sensor
MKTHDFTRCEPIPESAVAEASRWFALLHGPQRSAEPEILFRKWCEASPCNEAAYDLVTLTWERSFELPKPPLPLPRKWQRAGFRSGVTRAIAAVAVAMAVIAVAATFYFRNAGIRTATGEQRAMTLEDGTRVSLNTDTRLVPQYDEYRRAVTLAEGEALFEVASEPRRPFVVMADGHEVTALGTVFVVRSSPGLFSVTLMEGKVRVAMPEKERQRAPAPMQTLEPGERLILAKALPPKIDRPEIEKITAWRQGRIELDRTPLYLASAELNRYSTVKLAIEQPEAQVIPITGSFRAGDVASFADTLVRSCHLQKNERDGEIVLTGMPSQNCR